MLHAVKNDESPTGEVLRTLGMNPRVGRITRVRFTSLIGLLDMPAPPQETMVEFVRRARSELQAAGHRFLNDEEVTAWLEELRADDNRIEEIYRQIKLGSILP